MNYTSQEPVSGGQIARCPYCGRPQQVVPGRRTCTRCQLKFVVMKNGDVEKCKP